MKIKIITFLFLFFSLNIFSQTVSTLVPTNVGDDMHYAVNGFIYSSHYGGPHLRKINPVTGVVDTILTANTSTIGAIEMDDDLNIFVCSYDLGWLGKFKEGDGSIPVIASAFSGPAGITHDQDGNLYVATNQDHRIIKVLPNGTKETYASGSPLFWPTGITIDDSNNIYVVNMFSGEIIKITPDQQMNVLVSLPAIADQNPDLAYLAWANSRLFVCHFGNHVIYEIDPDTGVAEIIVGTGASGQNDGPALSATFQNPTGIVATPSGDTLYVTDGAAPNQRLRMIVLNSTSAVSELAASGFAFHKLYPNPANEKLSLEFALEKPLELSFQIVDTTGKVYFFQKKEKLTPGKHQLAFELKTLPQGKWFLSVQSDGFSKSYKFVKS